MAVGLLHWIVLLTAASDLMPNADVVKSTEDWATGQRSCYLSCRGHCNKASYIGSAFCYCDSTCLLLGDCCLDYESACRGLTRDNFTALVSRRLQTVLPTTCLNLRGSDVDMRVVDDCKNGDADDAKLCRSESALSALVILDSVIYRNRYCMRCNVQHNAYERKVTPRIVCGKNTTKAYRIWTDKGKEHFMQYVLTHCAVEYSLTLDYLHKRRLECRPTVSSCAMKTNATELQQSACRVYRADVVVVYQGRYKNRDCARCSSAVNVSSLFCDTAHKEFFPGAEPPGRLPSFAFLMQFDDKGAKLEFGETKICPALNYFDIEQEKCLRPKCSSYNKTCSASQVEQMLNNTVHVHSILMQLSAKFIIMSETDVKRIFESIPFTGERDNLSVMHIIDCNLENLTFSQTLLALHRENLTYPYEFCLYREFADSAEDFENAINTISNKRMPLVKQIAIRLPYRNSVMIESFTFRNHDAMGSYACPVGASKKPVNVDTFVRGNVPHKQENIDHFDYYNEDRMHTREENKVHTRVLVANQSYLYDIDNIPLVAIWTRDTKTDSWIEHKKAMICKENMLNCDSVVVTSDKYTKDGERLVVRLNNEQFVIDSHNFVFVSRNVTMVCKSSLISEVKLDEWIRSILTLIGNILSLIALAATIFTYSYFLELRTLPGRNVTNLAISLFLAQLIFQINTQFVHYGVHVCRAVGVVQHYAWLVAFFWMNVLAFDTCRTFTQAIKLTSRGREWKRLIVYVMYAWGAPIVLVGVCLTIDLATNMSYSYGGDTSCWIYGRHAVLYSFGIPIAAIILVNACLFIRVIIAIRRTAMTTQQAGIEGNPRRDVIVFARLTSLMGFTWLFGFLANIKQLWFLWYLFIVFNTLQGVFIFVSFVLTKRVRGFYKRTWRDRKKNSDSESARTQMSSLRRSSADEHLK